MTERTASSARSDDLQAKDFRRPIEFLYTEHDRQRVLCAALERLAANPRAPDAREVAAQIVDYCQSRLGPHYSDEEKDLFPMLRLRAEPDDGIGTILDMLCEEHAADDELLKRLIGPLRAIAERAPLADEAAFRADAQAFSVLQRRHLAWENGTILPLARRRLKPADEAELGRRMAARRGLVLA